MRDLIYIMTVLSSLLYFAFASIVGWEIDMEGSNSRYHLYVVLLDIISVCLLIFEWSRSGNHSKHRMATISLIIIFLLIGLFEGEINNTYFKQFIVFSIPSALIGLHYAGVRPAYNVYKWLDVLAVFMSLSLLMSFPRFMTSMLSADIYYSQTLSYNSAMTAILFLFLLDPHSVYQRFRFVESKLYKIYGYFVILAMCAMIFFSGGRGGFLTLLAGVLLYIYTYQGEKVSLLKQIFVSIIIIGLIAYAFFNIIGQDVFYLLERSVERIFSYISNGSIDVSATSGRDLIYNQAMNLFDQKPVFGYGLFSYIHSLGTYPHNIFVEWLLQGGMLLAIVFSILLLIILHKGIRILKYNPKIVLLSSLAVYPFTELMFSGTWLAHPLFWFTMSFIANYNNYIYSDET